MRNYIFIAGVLLFFIGSGGIPVRGEDPAVHIKKPVRQSISIRQKAQKRDDQWEREKTKMEILLLKLQAENKKLTSQQHVLRKKTSFMEKKIHLLKQNIEKSSRLSKEINPYLNEMYQRITQLIKEDSQFLQEERHNRLNSLGRMIENPEISTSEKYRKLMEALFIETEYGNTIEVYREKIHLAGKDILMNIFRLGRVSLFFQTPDKKTIGKFDPATSTWIPLPEAFSRDINAAFEIAAKRRPVDLIHLPLGKITQKRD